MGLKLYPSALKKQVKSIADSLKDVLFKIWNLITKIYYLHCKQFHNLYRIQNLKEQPGIA